MFQPCVQRPLELYSSLIAKEMLRFPLAKRFVDTLFLDNSSDADSSLLLLSFHDYRLSSMLYSASAHFFGVIDL